NSFVDKKVIERMNNEINSDFGRITYTEAIKVLQESGADFKYSVEWGIDLHTDHERTFSEEIIKRPVFATDYPQDIKAFYLRLHEDG
ncbi:asparagine--tRNA ligase, partial [Bacillus thuringiensis]|uniref:amino acid--tRNA ligase-related protein n=1 Tax=Bacillus thuringiensis TaxID=1428 RepID=UPI00283CA5C1